MTKRVKKVISLNVVLHRKIIDFMHKSEIKSYSAVVSYLLTRALVMEKYAANMHSDTEVEDDR